MAVFSFLDLIFPKKCFGCGRFGSYICDSCLSRVEMIEHPICPECERQVIGGKTHPGCTRKLGLDGLIVGFKYSGVARVAIQKIKYRLSYDISRLLIEILAQNIWRFNFPSNAILVPIPLHVKRRNWRGFNQSEILADELSRRFKLPMGDLIYKAVETKTQVGLSKKERKQNVKGVFLAKKDVLRETISGRNFILVDDVFTSGATMSEAAGVLKRLGAKSVWAMAVALG